MQLIRKHLEPGAVGNCLQVSHRREAVDGLIASIARIYADSSSHHNPDILSWEPGVMKDWLVETLLQGAYLREYHLWEKDYKAYFPAMAERNGKPLSMKSKQPFTESAKNALAAFNVAMPDTIWAAIERMRERANVMRHEAGLELDHFISELDYAEALDALEGFWNYLVERERVTG